MEDRDQVLSGRVKAVLELNERLKTITDQTTGYGPAERKQDEGDLKERVFAFLVELQESGICNMFDAASHICEEFGISLPHANTLLMMWMRSFS